MCFFKMQKNFFPKILKAIICVRGWVTPYQNPLYNLSGWDTPHTLHITCANLMVGMLFCEIKQTPSQNPFNNVSIISIIKTI